MSFDNNRVLFNYTRCKIIHCMRPYEQARGAERPSVEFEDDEIYSILAAKIYHNYNYAYHQVIIRWFIGHSHQLQTNERYQTNLRSSGCYRVTNSVCTTVRIECDNRDKNDNDEEENCDGSLRLVYDIAEWIRKAKHFFVIVGFLFRNGEHRWCMPLYIGSRNFAAI